MHGQWFNIDEGFEGALDTGLPKARVAWLGCGLRNKCSQEGSRLTVRQPDLQDVVAVLRATKGRAVSVEPRLQVAQEGIAQNTEFACWPGRPAGAGKRVASTGHHGMCAMCALVLTPCAPARARSPQRAGCGPVRPRKSPGRWAFKGAGERGNIGREEGRR